MIPSTTRSATSPTLDLSILKAESQRRLFKLLDKFEGTKTIVFDDKLIGPFEFVANASLLKQHDATKLFRLSNDKLIFTSDTDYILFFMRKDYHVAKLVAEVLQRADKTVLAKTSLVLVPQRCHSIERLLEHHKVDLEKLNSIEELALELFVLDTDILSMENEFVYRDMYLNDDLSSIHQIVEGLVKFQDIYGKIPRISGQGKGASLVCDLLLKRRKLQTRTTPCTAQVSQLVLIDRRIDLVTPFLTQLTYEGLLDEVFGIHHGNITLPAEKFQQLEEAQKKANKNQPVDKPKDQTTKKFELRSSEELFARLRDCHINAVAETLKQSAKNLQAEYDECNSEGKTIHEMGKIVKRLNHLKMAKNSQSNHVTIAEILNEQTLKAEFIIGLRIEHELIQEDRTGRMNPDIEMKLMRLEHPLHVLRLICLQSQVNNGIKSKICENYKREILLNYGEDYLLFLMQLEKANVLLSHEKFYESGYFNQLRSKFNLINDNVDECNPNHLSYVYGGFTPLSVMVAKTLTQFSQGPQLRLLSENLKFLSEPTVNYVEPSQPQPSSSLPMGIGEMGSNILSSSAMAAASLLLSTGSAAANSVTGGGGPTLRVRRNSATSSQSSSEETRIVLVFFIGGCTFAEISALRFLSQQEENNCEFIIGTTKIINGRTFLKSLWPLNGKAAPA